VTCDFNDVKALYDSCFVSISFFPAEIELPSAPNDSAAWDFCSDESVFEVPSHLNCTRHAAKFWRSRVDAPLLVLDSEAREVSGSGSSNVDMVVSLVSGMNEIKQEPVALRK
jgi:hypothetical protein